MMNFKNLNSKWFMIYYFSVFSFYWAKWRSCFQFHYFCSFCFPDICMQCHLHQISSDVLESWPLLQTFSCRPCPFLDSQNLVASANEHLPRLRFFEHYGAQTCPNKDNFKNKDIMEYSCISQNMTETCKSIPEWFIRHYVDR